MGAVTPVRRLTAGVGFPCGPFASERGGGTIPFTWQRLTSALCLLRGACGAAQTDARMRGINVYEHISGLISRGAKRVSLWYSWRDDRSISG